MSSADAPSLQSRVAAYAGAVFAVLVATAATVVIKPWVEPSLSLLFFPAVMIPALYGGYGPALLATFLSTVSLAYFFIPPVNSFQIGVDDAIRLVVFAAVSCATAWLGSARRRAEASQRRSLNELEHAVATLRKVSDWPLLIGPDLGASVQKMLVHAAGILGARGAAVAWETDDEPWVYVATTTAPNMIAKEDPTEFGDWGDDTMHPGILGRIEDEKPIRALFHTEELTGRVFFSGVDTSAADAQAIVALVAHEIGSSLSQLHLTDRVRHLAIREDRLRVSRDLHDGVLQALTGIRLELQDMATDDSPATDRLVALERALAIEQRELRIFIDELKPDAGGPGPSAPIATRLEEMRETFATEWRIPIALRVNPATLTLPRSIEQGVRLMIHEAVSNALKHAGATQVSIDVDATPSSLTVVVVDDGRGFAFLGRVEHEELTGANVGPISLRQRVAALNGRLAVESRLSGSRVEMVIPIASAA
jgi:signal transduction histidine kinase